MRASFSATTISSSVPRLKEIPRVELIADGGVDVGIAIAEQYRQKAAHIIDVFVAVDVPDTSALAVGDEERRAAARVLDVALGESLRAGRDAHQRPLQHRSAFCKGMFLSGRHRSDRGSEFLHMITPRLQPHGEPLLAFARGLQAGALSTRGARKSMQHVT